MTSSTAAPTGSLVVGSEYEGYPCEVFADIGGTGTPVHAGSIVISGGAATLPNGQQATTITACLGYVAPFMSAKLAYAAQLGSALAQKKRIDHLGLVMYNTYSQGVQFGQRFDTLDDLPMLEADQPTGDRNGVERIRRTDDRGARRVEHRRPALPARAGAGAVHGRRRGDRRIATNERGSGRGA